MNNQNPLNAPAIKIKTEMEALSQGVSFNWGRMSRLLYLVEQHKYWAGDSDSFTEWLNNNATSLGAKVGSLWRYYSSGRLYLKLQKDFPSLADKPLKEVSNELSPENLEILSKISRVAPDSVFKPLAIKVLSGEIKRSELRASWAAFRPVLDGKTARGRGVSAPTLTATERIENERMAAALMQNQLSSSDYSWTQLKELYIHKVFFDVKPQSSLIFDAVAVTCGKFSTLLMHGIEMCCHNNFDRPQYRSKLELLSNKCDMLWLALPFVPEEASIRKISKKIGILFIDINGIQTIRSPKLNENATDTSALSRLLLELALKK